MMIMLGNWGDDDDKNNSVMRIYVLGTPSSILPAYLILTESCLKILISLFYKWNIHLMGEQATFFYFLWIKYQCQLLSNT